MIFLSLIKYLVKRLKRRVIFKCDDYIKYKDFINRLDYIFVHEILTDFFKQRLFAIIIKCIKHSKRDRDFILNVSLLRLSSETIIINLLAISEQKLYVLSLKNQNLLYVD